MLLLTSTSDKLQVISGSTGDLRVHADYIDNLAGAISPDRKNTASIATATTTDVVLSPAASTQRNVKTLSVFNNHATTSNLVTVQHTDGTTVEPLTSVTLLAQELLLWTDDGWQVYDSSGRVKTGAPPFAVQADMEAAASLVLAVSPGVLQFHPSAAKFWIKSIVTGGVPAQTVSYNVTSITDTATGQLTVTIGTDFSSANWCAEVSVEKAATTLTVASDRLVFVRNAAQAAGTVIVECCDGTATTHLAADPAAWHVIGWGDQ